jgi:2,5-dioxopentanoate dehydrogenase
LIGERARTTAQLRLFASHIRQGDHLDRRHDAAQPERQTTARPEWWLLQRPVGPLAVLGASNFPLAFSVVGGDAASAFAVGRPAMVKVHSAHPGTAEEVAEAYQAAVTRCDLLPGGR